MNHVRNVWLGHLRSPRAFNMCGQCSKNVRISFKRSVADGSSDARSSRGRRGFFRVGQRSGDGQYSVNSGALNCRSRALKTQPHRSGTSLIIHPAGPYYHLCSRSSPSVSVGDGQPDYSHKHRCHSRSMRVVTDLAEDCPIIHGGSARGVRWAASQGGGASAYGMYSGAPTTREVP